jgi:riboflavin-specific deaminase-like protein
MERLLPDPGPAELGEQLDSFDPAELAGEERPYLFTNFALTVDGHATIEGRSGPIGSDADTALLMGLRERADAVLVGAGTIRTEGYGRLLPRIDRRRRREERGLPPDPLAVIVSGGLELPWDAGLFSSGAGEVLIFTTSDHEPPETATPVRVVRHADEVDLRAMLAELRSAGIRALLSEGGPRLHGELLELGLVDELFVTIGPTVAGGEGPGLAEGLWSRHDGDPIGLELSWLLREGDELFARWTVRR